MDPQLSNQPFQQPEQPVSPPPPVPSSEIPKILLIILAFIVFAGITAGAYILGTKQNQSQPVQKQQTATVPTPTPDPTTNWHTYTNTLYNFTLKIPYAWEGGPPEVSSNSFRMYMAKRFSTNTGVAEDYTPGRANIDLTINTEPAQNTIKGTTGMTKTEQVYVAGNSATKLTGASGVAGTVNFTNIVIPHNGKTFTFSFSTQDQSIEQQAKTEFDQILSTFKFTQ